MCIRDRRQGNINVDVVTNALKDSDQRIMGPRYMTAGMGDGGACHPRDNIALRWMAEQLDLGYDLFDSIMKAREISRLDRGACIKSGTCPVSFICNSEEEGFEDALVSVFNIINPGIMKMVYEMPSIAEIRCSKVKPKIKIYNTVEISPGITVCRYTLKNLPTSREVSVHSPIQFIHLFLFL